MPARLGQPAELIARAVAAVALPALAMIHVLDLPATLGPTPLVAAGYFGVIAGSIAVGAALIARSHPLIWLSAAALAASTMGGYLLTRTVGFLDDHGDIGNWRCSLGIAALSVEGLIIGLATWRARATGRNAADRQHGPQTRPVRREYSHSRG